MVKVELIYERTCPNTEAARKQLTQAFDLAGVTPNWHEWDITKPGTPKYTLGFGSPTILVNSQDVVDEASQTAGHSCRIYATKEGYSRIPAVDQIASALLRATHGT